jgi:hypothetical protein
LGRWGETECPRGPCSALTQTDGMSGHSTREAPCSRSGATRPRAGWETRGGATRHNGTICRLQGRHRGSHPFVENKGEMDQHFICQTGTANQNSKLNYDDVKTLTQILFSTHNKLAKLC